MALTKMDIVDSLVTNHTLSREVAEEFTNLMFELIKKTLEIGEEVKIPGLGNFSIRNKKARIGRNPKTKEEHIISARSVVVFKASQKLKDSIESGSTEDNSETTYDSTIDAGRSAAW